MSEYADRDVIQLDRDGGYYCRHVAAMTAEGLHSKADIAAELAWRDREIDRLKATHPQPVTPAGGEVDCGCGWGSDCEDAVIDRRLNSLHKDMRANGHNGGMVGVAWDRAVFRAGMENYPPVADAALVDAMEELADEWEHNGWPDPARSLRAAIAAIAPVREYSP